jgi:hypothetical protein
MDSILNPHKGLCRICHPKDCRPAAFPELRTEGWISQRPYEKV